jgi:hypothetical protein
VLVLRRLSGQGADAVPHGMMQLTEALGLLGFYLTYLDTRPHRSYYGFNKRRLPRMFSPSYEVVSALVVASSMLSVAAVVATLMHSFNSRLAAHEPA